MAMKSGGKQKHVSYVVFGPDGCVYSVDPDSKGLPVRLTDCEDDLKKFRERVNLHSDKPVLSGVMIRSNGKPASRKRVSQRSAKKRS